MADTNRTPLLPCPFCGGEPQFFSYVTMDGTRHVEKFYLACLTCGLEMPVRAASPDKTAVSNWWNKRMEVERNG